MKKLSPRAQKYTKKLSLAAGSLTAIACGGQEAEADIVYYSPLNAISVSSGTSGTTNWDVDFSDATAEFQLIVTGGTIRIGSVGLNGNGFVRGVVDTSSLAAARNLDPVLYLLDVGPGLNPPNGNGAYVFGAAGARAFIRANTTTPISTIGAPGFVEGDNYVGFRFNSSGTKYGWARINIDVGGGGLGDETLTVVEWAFEDTGGDIRVGAIPEPSSFALMAAGAAGVLAWKRRRRNESDVEGESDSDEGTPA